MRRSPRPGAGAATASAALLLLLGAVCGLVPASATPTPAPTPTPSAPSGETPTEPVADPLRVVLDRIRPAVLPEDPEREVTVVGTVRNTTDVEWTDLNAYLLSSTDPMTSHAEVAAAVGSDPTVDIGDRIVEPGLFADLPDLGPGSSTRFRLDVPRSAFEITGDPGVYWLGVHVLGTSGGKRLDGADGRARTFWPLVPSDTPGTEIAVAAQFRSRVVRTADGRLAYPEVLARRLARDGRLTRLLALSRTAQPRPLSWVVDPAVLEAVDSLARGNPPYEAQPAALPGGGSGRAGGSAAGADDPGPAPEAPTDAPPDDPAEDTTEDAQDPSGTPRDTRGPGVRRAARWLSAFRAEAPRHDVWALPYGDLDVAAAYTHGRAALSTYALEASARVLDALDIGSRRLVVPPSGHLPASALTALAPDVLTVLSPEAVPSLAGPLVQTSTGTTALLAGPPGSTRGPAPGATRTALAVRQRLLAQSALHALSADRSQPLVALLPAWWDPGPRWRAAKLFGGLDQRWLRLVDLDEVRRDARPAQLRLPEGLVHPEAESSVLLGADVLQATDDLITKGATFESVFIDVESVGDLLGRQALLTSSVWNRPRPRLAADRARDATALVDTLLDQVAVASPTFVTLSSEDGEFVVTLANGLEERIRVGLRASVTGSGLQLATPDAVTLEPNERRSVKIGVRSSGLGIHRVELQPVTETGLPVGTPATLSVRSSSVGFFLWVIMAGGSVLLFGAIAARIVRRVRRRRATHGPVLREQRELDRQPDRQPEGAQ